MEKNYVEHVSGACYFTRRIEKILLTLCFFSPCVMSFVLQLHTADLGGQGSTSEVVQSIMTAVQSTGPRTLSI